jgi:hypothetical protein
MNSIARRPELACRIAELLRLADRCQTEHQSSPKPRPLSASADPVRGADRGRHSDQAQSDAR